MNKTLTGITVAPLTRLFTLGLCIFAIGHAWATAPVPTAVWESGQFAQTKNGYSISYTGHTINGNGNIVINGSSSSAATINLTDVTAAGETKVTLLYKYKTLTNPSDCRYGATVCYNDTSKDYAYDMGFVSWSAANRGLLPAWHKDTSSFGVNKYSNEQPNFTPAMSSDGGYVIFSYDKTQSTISGYQGASLATVAGGSQTGYYFGGYDGKITHVGIGGPTGQTSANKWGAWGDLEIEKVAIFVGSIYSNSDLADYKWPSEVMRETLPERDMINLNISNGDSFAITGFGVDTISTLAGEMLDNAWQNTPSGNAVVSGDARNGRVTGVTAYDGTSKEATTLSNVMFTWAVEGSGTANYGYQDIENNPTFHKAWLARYSTAAETSSILVQSIPYRKYDIIVYCFGTDDSAFNPVFVNGIPYVGDTSLATDTKTRKATSSSETWGVRRASPSLGQTAIMLKGLENPELSLTIRSGATSICAVQILRDMSEGVWPTSKKVISLNLMSAKSSSGTTPAIYGLEPVPDAAWTKDGLSSISSSGTDVTATIMEWDGSSAVEASSVAINEKAANAHNWSGYNYTPQNQILSGYLDDTSRQIAITVTDVPYDVYDVIVYCATDNSNKQFGPVKVNDTPYRWDDDKQCAVVASSADSTAETRWGATQSRLPAYGRNAIRIPNQTRSTLTIIGANNANNARGGIAAIQIVEAHSGLKVYSNGSWSGGTEPTSGDAVIVVDGDTALAIDGTANLGTVTITGTGTLTLSGSGKFTATTIAVESLATVNANPDRLDATTYVGSGTVVYSGGAPETGKGWTDSANWTGTVEIDDLSFGYSITLATYGNANSVVCMNNVEAPLTLGESDHNIKELKIGSYGFDQIGAYSSGGAKNFNLPFKLTGSGVYTIATTGSDEKSVNFQGDASEFAGKIVFAGSENNSRVVFGASTSRAFQDGSIVIGANGILKIAYPMQWSITKAPVYVDQTGLLENTGGLLDVAYGFKIDGTLKTPGIGFAWNKMSSATGFALGDTGVLELTSSENTNDATTGSTPAPTSVDMSKVTGTGTLKYTSTAGWRAFTDNDAYMPATTLTIQVELADSLIITKCDNGETVIGNLAGGKNIRSDWTPAGSGNRTLTVTQSKDTKWDGKFVSNRITQFNVVPPAEGTPGTLTLNGTNTETIPMQVNGSVNLTGTWGGATTVAGTFGGTGTLTGNLTFNAGSTFKAFARDEDDDDGLTVTGSVTYPASGTVTVDVSALGSPESDVVLISKSGLDETKFALKSGSPVGYALKVEGDALKLKANATVAITVPTVANTTVTVTANDTPVEGDNGVYTVPYGSAVVVTYAAVSGYKISGTATYNIASATTDETITVDEDLRSDLIVATFNGTSYTTLQAAVNAWAAADYLPAAMNPVTLIGNTTVAGLTISAHNTGMLIPMQLIGGGSTLTGPVTIAAGATLQPLNITLAGDLTVNGTLVVQTTLSVGGTVTFADKSCITVTTLSDSVANVTATGTVTIQGELLVYLQSASLEAGTYLLATGSSVDADDAVATVKLNGTEDPAWTFSATETSLVLKAVAAEVEGVKYETFAEAVVAAAGEETITLLANASYTLSVGETLIVAAGSFTMTVTAPAGYAVSQSGSGVVTYTTQKYVAKLRNPNVGSTTYADEVYYTSFAAAVADVVEQTQAVYADYVATVTLLDDITLDAAVTVGKKMKLDLNGKTLTASGINAINNSTKLTVQGSSGSISVTSGSSVVLTAAAATLTVSGGVTLSTTPTTSVEGKYVKSATAGGWTTYTVADHKATVYDSGDAEVQKYDTVADAVSAATDGQKVRLFADSSDAITLNGKSITLIEGSYTFSGTLTGNGTIKMTARPNAYTYNGAANGGSLFASGWTGTFQVAWNPGNIRFVLDDFGNANSTVEIVGVNGAFGAFPFSAWSGGGAPTVAPKVTITSGTTWTVSNGNTTESHTTTFSELSGGGNLVVNGGTGSQERNLYYTLTKVSGYTGTLSGSRCNYKIVDITTEAGVGDCLVKVGENFGPYQLGTTTVNGDTVKLCVDTLSEQKGIYIAVAQVGDNGYASLANAVTAAGEDGMITILANMDTATVGPGQKIVVAAGVTVGTVSWGEEYNTAISITGDGSTQYTASNKATTYYWTDADAADHNWSTVGNWAVGSSAGSVATRSPTSIDGVVFGDGASVAIAGASCAAMSVAGDVAISGSGDLNIYGDVTDGGSGALTLSGVCLNNWAEESSTGVAITVAPTVRFVNGAGIASNKRGAVTINGAVSIGGLFKLWDIATVSFSGGLSVDSGATLQLNQNLDLSGVTTVFNGNFSKTVNNNESTTLTLGAVTVSSSTTPTISAETIVLSGAVAVSDGATFTIPASGVSIGDDASFELAGTAKLVDNSGNAEGKVVKSPSVDYDANIYKDGNTYSVVGCGYLDGTTYVITNTVEAVALPASATSAKFYPTSTSPISITGATGLESYDIYVKYIDSNSETQEQNIYYLFTLAPAGTGSYTLTVNPSGRATVGEEKIYLRPELRDTVESPMAIDETSETAKFTVKSIPGLYYAVQTGAFNGSGVWVPDGYGDAVQATSDSTSVTAPEFSGTVQYYKIGVGLSAADVSPTP